MKIPNKVKRGCGPVLVLASIVLAVVLGAGVVDPFRRPIIEVSQYIDSVSYKQGGVAYNLATMDAAIPATSDDLTEGATNRYVTTGDETKLGHITVTQAVDLDAIEAAAAASTAELAFTAVTQTVNLDTMESDIATLLGAGPSFSDSAFRVQDNADATKQIAFEASTVATGTTRTITMPNANVDLGAIATNTAKVTNATHTGDVTGSGILTIAAGSVDPAMLSATGAANSSTFYRGDNAWAVPVGAGDMALAATQTITGDNTFTDGTLLLAGATSGSLGLHAAAVAGATDATFQTGSGTVPWLTDVPADTDDLLEGTTNRYMSAAEEARVGYLTVTQAVNLDAMETDLATLLGGPTLGSFADNVFYIVDNADATKRGLFQASVITTATDRTYTLPDASGVIALTSDFANLGTPTTLGLANATGLPAAAVGNGLTDAQVSDTLTSSNFTGSGSTSNAVDLATAEVGGDLPLANIAQFTVGTFAGRALGAGTGDLTALTNAQARASLSNLTDIASAASIAWTASGTTKVTFNTATANATVAASTGADGQFVVFMITKSATAFTVSWDAQFHTLDGTAMPAIPTTTGKIGYYYFLYNAFLDDWILQGHTEYAP